ncbi:MAG: LuxR C-terminal-related transcriptional regulator [Gammaproteobacteria bacterium]|nr:LuxR C-terminal-related transcriptional regulator [Gammaproteobacteria bacterium]MDD9896634.1 LuxR C-terminal-related transcriptional regulator [Gammaproteobacteria bacterium]MDD9958052.1 LuxR C-terminal-related transcriptional regulator [Gammaproteobacteria bacterium]
MNLTKRQLEILSLMDRGLSNQEMARTLHISVATVKTHVQHLYNAFNVNNRVNCLRQAKKHRLR